MPGDLVVPETALVRRGPAPATAPEGAGDLVLVRDGSRVDRPELWAGMRAVGARGVRLPADAELAAWVVNMALLWRDGGEEHLERALLGLVSLLPPGPGMPVRPWGDTRVAVPAVPPRMLARLARLAWRPCGRCDGGGVEGGLCGRCGSPVRAVA